MIATRKALIVVAALVLMALGLPWGGAVPAAFAQTISVTAADPTAATQGTYALPVTVKGSGFKRGAKAAFLRHDNSLPGGITVTGTRYISSTQLVATVDVAPDATFDVLFDIQVTNADGRTGKGTELFKVTEKIDPCAVAEPVPTLNPYTSGAPGLPGAFDSTFGMDGTGKALGPRYFTGQLGGSGIAVQSIDGEDRYVVAGHLYDPCVNNGQSLNVWAVARYLSDGSLDTSFGATPPAPGTGIVTMPFSVSADARRVLIDGNNRIVVVGYAPSSSKKGGTVNVPTVVRYFADGRIDTSFGATGTTPGTGIARVPTGGVASLPKAAAFQSDGKIVIVAQDGYSGYLRVTRLSADGALDTAFNGSGQHLFDKFPSFIGGMAIDSEQRIVVAGAKRRGPSAGTLWRFTTAGTLDQGFGVFDPELGTAGLVSTYVSGLLNSFTGVAVDGSDLVVTGEAYHPDTENPTELPLARYNAAGMLLWELVVPCEPGETRPSWGVQLAIQPDGRILIGGNREVGNAAGDLAIWRFLPDGSLDGSFGGTGWVADPVTTDTGGHVKFSALVQRPDGKLVIVGDVRVGTMQVPYMFLARLWQ